MPHHPLCPESFFYAEHDHYNMDDKWATTVDAAKTRFDHVLIEKPAEPKLLDVRFVPTTDFGSRCLADAIRRESIRVSVRVGGRRCAF